MVETSGQSSRIFLPTTYFCSIYIYNICIYIIYSFELYLLKATIICISSDEDTSSGPGRGVTTALVHSGKLQSTLNSFYLLL